MPLYSAELEMCATCNIQASSLDEATKKLNVTFGVTFDSERGGWFSNAMFGSWDLPEVSLSTSMTIYGYPAKANFTCSSDEAIESAILSRKGAKISDVFPTIDDFENEGMNIYSAEIIVCVESFVQVDSPEIGRAIFEPSAWGVDMDYPHEWFVKSAIKKPGCPVVLSSAMTIVSSFAGSVWTQGRDEVFGAPVEKIFDAAEEMEDA